jgi:V/A-type H+-transporting ATPase subunit F
MLSFVISENRDSYLGLKLAGMKGVYSKDPVEIEKVFKRVVKDKDIGIIFLTEKAYKMIEPLVIETKRRNLYPLITIIPDRHGYQEESGVISKYIKESVGL